MPLDGLWVPPRSRELLPQSPWRLKRGPLTSGLAGYWPLAGDARDNSGNRNDGTLVGGPTAAIGPMGPCLLLSGSAQSVTAAPVIPTGGSATFFFWVRPANVSQVAGIINQRASPSANNSYSIGLNYEGGDVGTLSVQVGNSAGNAVAISYGYNVSSVLSASQFTSATVMISTNAGAGQKVILLLNNEIQPQIYTGAKYIDVGTPSFYPSTDSFRLGTVNNTGSNCFAGALLGVRIYCPALSLAEVAVLGTAPFADLRTNRRRIYYAAPSRRASGAFAEIAAPLVGAASASARTSGVMQQAGASGPLAASATAAARAAIVELAVSGIISASAAATAAARLDEISGASPMFFIGQAGGVIPIGALLDQVMPPGNFSAKARADLRAALVAASAPVAGSAVAQLRTWPSTAALSAELAGDRAGAARPLPSIRILQ